MCEIALIPLTDNGQLTATTHYHGDFEMRAVTGVGMRKFHYLGEGLFCVIPADNQPRYYYLMEDNLGSIVHAINGEAASEYDAWYDAWGSPTVTANGIGLFRGYGGHEMLPQYRLINMDGRMYDSTLGRFLSPDSYVQEPDNSQNYNRYSYCLNNPLKYTDPDGELFVLAAILGGAMGAYIGGSIANNSYNPAKWDFSSPKTWGYMLSGGIVGGISGYVGAAISQAGFAGSNTLGILASSTINSLGTNAYTLGATPIVLSAGAFSYDFTNREFGFLWKKGNSAKENWGYAMGALANVRDVNNLIDATEANLYTQTFDKDNPNVKDYISHSAIVSKDGEILMSFGPDEYPSKTGYWGFAMELRKSKADYDTHMGEGIVIKDIVLNKNLFSGLRNVSRYFPYQGITSNCVNWASVGLWLNGIPNIGIHPFLLHGSMAVYGTGLYNILAVNLIKQ